MDAEKQALLEAWWAKASGDLAAVEILLAAGPPLLGIAVYHCQQAAEKAVKTWLVFKDIPFPKIHDINRLLGLCVPVDRDFERLRPHAAFLNPFAAEFRYPGDIIDPLPGDAEEALRLAAIILDFVKERIPFLP